MRRGLRADEEGAGGAVLAESPEGRGRRLLLRCAAGWPLHGRSQAVSDARSAGAAREAFEVLGSLPKRPYWFHSEYLKSPKAVQLEAWLVEVIFGEWAPEGRSRPALGPGVAASSAGLSGGRGCPPAPLLPPPLPPPLLTMYLPPVQAGVENTSRTSGVCHRPCFTFISGTRTRG